MLLSSAFYSHTRFEAFSATGMHCRSTGRKKQRKTKKRSDFCCVSPPNKKRNTLRMNCTLSPITVLLLVCMSTLLLRQYATATYYDSNSYHRDSDYLASHTVNNPSCLNSRNPDLCYEESEDYSIVNSCYSRQPRQTKRRTRHNDPILRLYGRVIRNTSDISIVQPHIIKKFVGSALQKGVSDEDHSCHSYSITFASQTS